MDGQSAISQQLMTRRRLFRKTAAGAGLASLHSLLPPWARSATPLAAKGVEPLSGNQYDLEIAETQAVVDGRKGRAVTVNGNLPAPLLRWREGDEVVIRVTNRLDEDTSIHWHGILVPFQMDGVPGVTFPGIKPGETFEYKFRVPQNGTYWYHSHSGLQEQLGHYGPLVIEPKGGDPVEYDREHIIVLSDWSFTSPERIFAKLKKQSDNFNFQRRTVGDFFDDLAEGDLKNRGMWGKMRMSPVDIADVTSSAYHFLINGHAPSENWTALFEPGQRVRLRIVNASAMTIYDVRIPGLPMTVVQADGLNVRPVETDEFQIGVAETYDVIVQPERPDAFTLMCESIERSGYARATLAPRAGMEGPVPPLRPRPTLTMKDMGMGGMSHGGMAQGGMDSGSSAVSDTKAAGGSHDHLGHTMPDMKAPDASAEPPANEAPHAGHSMPGMKMPDASKADPMPTGDPHAGNSMAGMDMSGGMDTMQTHEHRRGPGVQNVAMNPTRRIDEPGAGLLDAQHRTLAYTQLESLEPNPDARPPGREIELHLTSNMERYMWSFDGKKFSDVVDPIVFYKDERVRLTMINDTMMPHPIHLHGMFFDVVTGAGNHKPRKHTIIVKPAERVSLDITADAVGDWAFHCHLLYHMHAGMFQVVSVVDRNPEAHS